VYLPDIDIDVLLETAAGRLGPHVLSKIDDHTVQCSIGDVSYLPLPPGRAQTIPGLLSIDLPDSIKAEQEFTVTVHQFSGLTKAIIGAFQVTIPVRHAPELLAEEIRTLAVMRHIVATMAADDRWYPVMVRYLAHLEDRVRGFGGEPARVPSSPDGGPDDQPAAGADHGRCCCSCHDPENLVTELFRRLCLDADLGRRILEGARGVADALADLTKPPRSACHCRCQE